MHTEQREQIERIEPTITDILRAARFLRGRIRTTPLEYSFPLSGESGAEVFVKWENQQKCGSFKIRGALNKMFSLSEEERSRGVITASSGNHAQGVALAAKMLKVRAVICVPGMCPETKRQAIRNLGEPFAELRICGHFYDEAEQESFRLQKEEGLTYVSAFEDPHIVAGQGTLGLEMLLEEPELEAILCPLSGGGLLSGVLTAARALKPGIEVWGAHAQANPAWPEAFKAGKVVPVEEEETIAEGLCGSASAKNFGYIRQNITGISSIPEEAIERAMAFVYHEHHQIIEGAAAVSVGALLEKTPDLRGRKVGVVISGGNVEGSRLMKILEKHPRE